MKALALLAVIAGGICQLILTNLFALPLELAIFNTAGLSRLPQNQVTNAYLAALHANGLLYTIAILLGLLASCCGGSIAALLAKHDRVFNGACSAWAVVCIDLYSFTKLATTDGLALQILLVPAAPLAGALGGYLVARFQGRSTGASV